MIPSSVAVMKAMDQVLIEAVKRGNTAEVRVLLQQGASVNAADQCGRTPLHWAAIEAKSEEIIELLIGAGANLDATDNQQNTPLHYAVACDTVIAEILCHNGASLDSRNAEGKSPIEIAAEEGECYFGGWLSKERKRQHRSSLWLWLSGVAQRLFTSPSRWPLRGRNVD